MIGDRRCVGKQLETCGGTPETWQPTETCASAALCLDGLAADAGSCASPTCAVDQYQCVGQFMQKCNASQTGWVALGQCASLELCQSGLATGQCTAPVCDTNQKQCTGKAMEKCKAGRDGWELLSTCETPELCADGLAGGQCVAPVCDVGQNQCSGDHLSLMTCNAGRNGWDSQSCTYGCFLDAAMSYCGACSPGSHQCNGASYQTCNAKAKWEDTSSCGALEQCALGPQSQMLCVSKLVALPGNHAIDATEVTRAQYAAWLATNPAPTGLPAVCGTNSSYTPDATCMAGGGVCQGTGCGKHPQVCIEWCDAYAYCKSVGKRLCGKIGGGPADHALYMDPTHDAWFASCSAGGLNHWPYGNTASGTNCNIASGVSTEVGTKPACISSESSYQGTFDLSGNVWEWEDSCDGTASGDDYCRIRGGAFRPCFWNSVNNDACDYPYNADRCDYGAQLKRKLNYYDTGFRCCSL